jgi:hypothetical protein
MFTLRKNIARRRNTLLGQAATELALVITAISVIAYGVMTMEGGIKKTFEQKDSDIRARADAYLQFENGNNLDAFNVDGVGLPLIDGLEILPQFPNFPEPSFPTPGDLFPSIIQGAALAALAGYLGPADSILGNALQQGAFDYVASGGDEDAALAGAISGAINSEQFGRFADSTFNGLFGGEFVDFEDAPVGDAFSDQISNSADFAGSFFQGALDSYAQGGDTTAMLYSGLGRGWQSDGPQEWLEGYMGDGFWKGVTDGAIDGTFQAAGNDFENADVLIISGAAMGGFTNSSLAKNMDGWEDQDGFSGFMGGMGKTGVTATFMAGMQYAFADEKDTDTIWMTVAGSMAGYAAGSAINYATAPAKEAIADAWEGSDAQKVAQAPGNALKAGGDAAKGAWNDATSSDDSGTTTPDAGTTGDSPGTGESGGADTPAPSGGSDIPGPTTKPDSGGGGGSSGDSGTTSTASAPPVDTEQGKSGMLSSIFSYQGLATGMALLAMGAAFGAGRDASEASDDSNPDTSSQVADSGDIPPSDLNPTTTETGGEETGEEGGTVVTKPSSTSFSANNKPSTNAASSFDSSFSFGGENRPRNRNSPSLPHSVNTRSAARGGVAKALRSNRKSGINMIKMSMLRQAAAGYASELRSSGFSNSQVRTILNQPSTVESLQAIVDDPEVEAAISAKIDDALDPSNLEAALEHAKAQQIRAHALNVELNMRNINRQKSSTKNVFSKPQRNSMMKSLLDRAISASRVLGELI